MALPKKWLLSIVVITIFAIVLRLAGISEYGFDGDEVFSLGAANSNWVHLLSTAAADKSHPPLFYAILKLWLGLGSADEGWVRSVSLLFGALLIPITAFICRLVRIPIIDAAFVLFLIASNGLLIYYSQHARMFALFQTSCAFSILCFIQFLSESGSSGSFWRLTATNLIMVYSHYWGWLAIVAETFICIGANRPIFLRFLKSALIVMIGFSPWVGAVAVASLKSGALLKQIAWMGADTPGATEFAWLLGNLNGILDFDHATTFGILLFFAPVFAFAILAAKRGSIELANPALPWFWLILIVTPPILTTIASHFAMQNLWGQRHLSMIATPYYIVLGLSIAAGPNQKFRVVFRCAILSWAVAASALSLNEGGKKFHWEILAHQIVETDRTIPIYASEAFVAEPLQYHLLHSTNWNRHVEVRNDLVGVSDQRFWFVYRNTTWPGAPPEAQLANLNAFITAKYVVYQGGQKVSALLIQKR